MVRSVIEYEWTGTSLMQQNKHEETFILQFKKGAYDHELLSWGKNGTRKE